VAAQLNEFAMFQNNIFDLERTHSKIKLQYEEDLARYRREFESRGIPLPPPAHVSAADPRMPRPGAGTGGGGGGAGSGSSASGAGGGGGMGGPGFPDGVPPPLLSSAGPGSPPNPYGRSGGADSGGPSGPPSGGFFGAGQGGVGKGSKAQQSMHHSQHNSPHPMSAQQQQQQQQAPPPQQHPMQQVQHQPIQHHVSGVCELDPDQLPPVWKKEGADWVVAYNPQSPSLQKSRLGVDLVHSFEHGSVVCCVKFSNDGKFLATGCNRSAQIFDMTTGTKTSLIDETTPKDGDLYIRSVCFDPTARQLATGAEDRVIRVWDIARRKVKWTLKGHDQDIYSLDWSKDGRVIVSGSGDKTVKVWDVETGECIRTISNPEDVGPGMKEAGVTSVAVSPTYSRCIATGSLDEMVRVWDIRTGQLLERFEGHRNSVYSVAFSPDGRSIVSGSLDKTLKIWDLSFPTLTYLARQDERERSLGPAAASQIIDFDTVNSTMSRHTLAGHKDFVLSVAFAGGDASLGRWVVSGSKDRTVTFWDARRAGPGRGGGDLGSVAQFMLQGHKNSVISVALAPVGGLFATGSGDWRARVW
ncbi:WD40-repeat-containing domain protein, partial [Blyttiomyces helicus]